MVGYFREAIDIHLPRQFIYSEKALSNQYLGKYLLIFSTCHGVVIISVFSKYSNQVEDHEKHLVVFPSM